MKMPVSVAEALTRSGGLIAGGSEGSEMRGILLVKFPLIFFGTRSKLMGAWDTGTPLTSSSATLHHYNSNRTASRDALRCDFSLELVDSFPGSMKTGREISRGF